MEAGQPFASGDGGIVQRGPLTVTNSMEYGSNKMVVALQAVFPCLSWPLR